MRIIRFSNGESFELQGYDSTATQLNFRLYESDVNSMKEMLQDSSNTSLIQIVDVNEDTQDEKVIVAFKGYTNLSAISTEYGVVTSNDYSTEDDSTESGFAEVKHDISKFSMSKATKVDIALESLKESQAIQDGAIGDLGEAVSEIAG